MKGMSAEPALQRLLDGNQRFVAEQLDKVPLSARRREVAEGQAPFAAVLGCADSRVPTELVFDCSVGDLFVVRTAGHVLGPAVVGSLEFAATQLCVPLIVVLGHTRCGAVQTALLATHGDPLPGSIGALVDAILPAVQHTRALPDYTFRHAAVAHVEATVAALRSTTVLAPLVASGTLRVVGALYDLDSGQVQLLG